MSLGRACFQKGSPLWTFPLSTVCIPPLAHLPVGSSLASLHSHLQGEFSGHGDVLIPKHPSLNELQPTSQALAK